MRSTTKILSLAALLFFSLSLLQAQNPITRRVKGDTIRKKSEVILTKGDLRNRGEDQNDKQQVSYSKQFNDLLSKADQAESFNERKEFLLKAREICHNQLKNDCKDLINDKIQAAYSAEINRLLARAQREDEYNDKMRWLNTARELSEESYVSQTDRSKVREAFQSEYQWFLERGNNRSYDVARRMRYFRSALRFCQDYGHIWGAGDCNENIAGHARRLFDDALDQQKYDEAQEICSYLPGLNNCRQTVYQSQFDDLLDRAAASADLDDQKKLLEQARDICTSYLQNGCSRTINFRLNNLYAAAVEKLLEKARNTHDLRSKLRYYADAEALCREVSASSDCQESIDQERNQAFNANFNNLLADITRTNDYERQQELLKEAERLIAKGQLSDERWEEIRRIKHLVHYNRFEYLLFQNSGSFESQMRYLEQAEAINEHYLNHAYNRKIEERKVTLITNEINSVLRYENRAFNERIDRLTYAEQLTQQLHQRHRHQLLPKIAEERQRIVLIEYDALVQAARTERRLDEKVHRYEEALRFCSEFTTETAVRGGCEQLQQERREVVSDVYRNMIADAQRDIRSEFFEKAEGTLSLATEVYQKYGNDLYAEMPISTAYQQLYNQYLQSAKKYSANGAFDQARQLLKDAKRLEDGQYWVVGSNNPIQGQLDEIDRLEMDQKLDQLEKAYERGQTIQLLGLLKESCELYAENSAVYNNRQTSRLSQLYYSIMEQSIQKAKQEIQDRQYANARSGLLQLKVLSDQYRDLGNQVTLKNSIDQGFYQWYARQMDQIEGAMKRNADLSALAHELDQLYSLLNEDRFVKKINGTEARMFRLFHQLFDSYEANILTKLSRNDFDTATEERQLEAFYRNHQAVFTQAEFDRTQSGIAFARHYQKARWLQDRQQYRQALDQWNEALNYLNYAPAAYQKAGLAEELKSNRNAAFTAEINAQLSQVRKQVYQESQIEAYRALMRFVNAYQLPLSVYMQEDLKSLKEDVFGEICTQRSRQFYFKLESGDDAINRNDYTAAIRFYQEAKSLAMEFPECGIDIGLVDNKIENYEAAGVFQKKKIALDQLQDRVYSSKQESDFRAYQNAYQELSDFYNEKIMNKGFHLNLVPYQRKVVQIRNNDFWSFVIWTHCTDRIQLSFTNDLLSELIQDKRFPEATLEELAAKMATQNYKVFGGRNYKDTFEYYEIERLKRDKRFKAFKKAYKKQFKKVS